MRFQLQAWIDFANENGAVILFDAAYEIMLRTKICPTAFMNWMELTSAPLRSAPCPKQQVSPVQDWDTQSCPADLCVMA